MRIVLLVVALAGCATVESQPAGDDCGASRLTRYLGQARSDALVAEVARISAAPRVRWIGPNDVVTMDYLAERLNVRLDGEGRISGFSCG